MRQIHFDVLINQLHYVFSLFAIIIFITYVIDDIEI